MSQVIHSLYIDGFKSLEDLTIEFKPGLNALVGPNGSGKSNVVDAFWFVSSLFENDLVDISEKLGLIKVSELFCLTRKKKEIHLIIHGTHRNEYRNLNETQIQTSESLENIVSLYTKFNLEYRIRFDREAVEPFVYTEQRLEFEFLVGGLNSHQSNKLIVQYSKGLCKVIEFKMNDIETNVSHEVTTLPSLLESNFGAYKTNSIVTTLKKHFFPIKNMVQDISFGQVYAIHPPVIREDTYKVGAPKLLTDGSGLASTLFELKHSENEIFHSIIEGMKLISSGIVGISVNYVESRQRIEVNTEICSNQSGGANEVFPLELLSDGTLKWYALVTAMALSKDPLVIEEPENYLSPSMQQLFISYLRDELDNRDNFGVITSHSETLVDCLEPDELILVRDKNGRTEVSRVKEIDKLITHMRKSEYGLGWYFQSDLLVFYCFNEAT